MYVLDCLISYVLYLHLHLLTLLETMQKEEDENDFANIQWTKIMYAWCDQAELCQFWCSQPYEQRQLKSKASFPPTLHCAAYCER